MVHGLEQEYEGQIEFEYLNIDDPNTAQAKRDLGFRYQPHLLLIDGEGTVIEEWVGYVTQPQLETAFAKVLEDVKAE